MIEGVGEKHYFLSVGFRGQQISDCEPGKFSCTQFCKKKFGGARGASSGSFVRRTVNKVLKKTPEPGPGLFAKRGRNRGLDPFLKRASKKVSGLLATRAQLGDKNPCSL